MTAIADQYRTADAPLRQVIDAVPTDRWSAPSPCEGWTARDVVRHLVDAQRSFLTDRGVALPDAPDVDADPADAWHAHADAVAALLEDEAVTSIAYDGHFGPATVGDTMLRFYAFDMVAHRWDLAQATGQDASFSDAELDQLETGMDGFGDALYSPGVARGGVEAPEGASRQDRVLARLGRVA